jgi:hypothetical protein
MKGGIRLAKTKLFKLTIFLAVTAFVAISASATDEIVKWSQMPNMGPFGYSFSSESAKPSRIADDFLCEDGKPVVAVRWWGSYYQPHPAVHFYPNSDNWPDPTTPTDTPIAMLTGFDITIYAEVAPGVDPLMPWGHPGNPLYQKSILMSDISETLYGTAIHTGGVEQNVWEYYATLAISPDIGFEQEEGTTYWISIQALHQDPAVQWGWQEADYYSGWGSNGVQSGYSEIFPWNLVPNKDFAFQLITVEGDIPEPASLFAFSLMLLGLVLRKRAR